MTSRKYLLLFTLISTLLNTQSVQSQNVLYYGFFFDEAVATSIKAVTDTYLRTTLEAIPSFKTFLETASNTSSVTDILTYYTKPVDPNTLKSDPYYHVTTKYCGGDADCTSYQSKVSNSLNQMFTLQLIGYYFTPRTFGIRVKLTPEQEALFDNGSKLLSNDNPHHLMDISYDLKLARATYPDITFEHQALDLSPTDDKPHITVGCAPGISAEVTGSDLLEIISYEANFIESMSTSYTMDDGQDGAFVVRYKDTFVVYPQAKILANAIFKSSLYSGGSGGSSTVLGSIGGLALFSCLFISMSVK